MSQDQLSSSAPGPLTRPIPKPRPRARSDPVPPMPTLQERPKPPVHSNSAEEFRQTTAASTTQPRPRRPYSHPSSYSTQGSAESGVSTSTSSSHKGLSFDSIAEEEDLYCDDGDTNASTHPMPIPGVHHHSNASPPLEGEASSQARRPRPPSNADVPATRGVSLTEGDEVEEMRRRKVALETEIRNLTTQVNQLKHDEKTWARKQLNLEQREYAVVEKERKLKMGEEELASQKGDQQYQLNQEKSRLQAWDDLLVMRKKNLVAEEFELRNSMSASAADTSAQVAQLADRMYAVQQREFELMQNQQNLEAWARQIDQDKATIERRWYDLRQREAELEERNRVLHHQQQARFQYSTDMPDANVFTPTHAGFDPQGPSQHGTVPAGYNDFGPIPGRPRDQSFSSRSSIDSSTTGEMPGYNAMTSTPRKASSIDVDAELAASMAATPQERAPLDRAQISQDEEFARQLVEKEMREQELNQGRKVSVDQDYEIAVRLQQEQLAVSDLTATNNFGEGGGEDKVRQALQEAMTRVHDREKQEKEDFLLATHIQKAGATAQTNDSGASEQNDLS